MKRQLTIVQTVATANEDALYSSRESIRQLQNEHHVVNHPVYDDFCQKAAEEMAASVTAIDSLLRDLERSYRELSPAVEVLFEDIGLIANVITTMDKRIKTLEDEVGYAKQ